jgi:hypothetical protein
MADLSERDDDREGALRLGATWFVCKPIEGGRSARRYSSSATAGPRPWPEPDALLRVAYPARLP